MRRSIEYLNARRAIKPASGGKNYSARERAKYAPDYEPDSKEEIERRRKRAEVLHAHICATAPSVYVNAYELEQLIKHVEELYREAKGLGLRALIWVGTPEEGQALLKEAHAVIKEAEASRKWMKRKFRDAGKPR
jgi:hypothetical protein